MLSPEILAMWDKAEKDYSKLVKDTEKWLDENKDNKEGQVVHIPIKK